MKKIVVLFILLAFCFGSVKLGGSIYQDNVGWFNRASFESSLIEDDFEGSSDFSYYKSNLNEEKSLRINQDYACNSEFSPFTQLSYFKNSVLNVEYTQFMVGESWLWNPWILTPPYRQKTSLAFIIRSNSAIKTSFRHKFEGYYNKLNFKVVAYWVTGGKSLNIVFKYPVAKNIEYMLAYNYKEENKREDKKIVFGYEINL